MHRRAHSQLGLRIAASIALHRPAVAGRGSPRRARRAFGHVRNNSGSFDPTRCLGSAARSCLAPPPHCPTATTGPGNSTVSGGSKSWRGCGKLALGNKKARPETRKRSHGPGSFNRSGSLEQRERAPLEASNPTGLVDWNLGCATYLDRRNGTDGLDVERVRNRSTRRGRY